MATKSLREQWSTKPIYIFMNEKIRDPKCRLEGLPCISVQKGGKTVNVHQVGIYHDNILICTVQFSNKANPDIKSHAVHAWVEVEPEVLVKFG